MKKLILFLSMSLLVGTLIACTDTNIENEGVPEETNQEEIQETTNEVVYEIPMIVGIYRQHMNIPF
jgi:hypothetical protein